jgi:predicted PhzF superfamily epimerase YddE/YHI9
MQRIGRGGKAFTGNRRRGIVTARSKDPLLRVGWQRNTETARSPREITAVKIPLYQLDAFTRKAFGGNPAAVCPLERWLGDDTLQAIAAENNLAETAFYVAEDGAYRLRWFTPVAEVPLCGHATLATGYVILNVLEPGRERVRFETLSGPVEVARDGGRLALDFPALPLERELDPDLVAGAIGVRPEALWEADRGMAVLGDAAQVRELHPDIGRIAELPFKSLIVTARGVKGDCDFVSRFFAPKLGIAEDPVTGSAHCVLAPYWSGVLGKPSLFARQLSPRGGELWVEDRGKRVRLSGDCVLVIEGSFALS